jgi:transcriptional regulator with XRE-family HTH domain
MHEESFGRRLRAERERRRITLELIAANTKIPVGLLRNLEQDRLTHWPGGIFRRSFVKSYAAAVGLDPDETLQEFLARYPEGPIVSETSGSNGSGSASLPRRMAAQSFRLTLAEERSWFVAGAVLASAKRRILAAAWDVGSPLLIAGLAYAAIGLFWIPLGVVMLSYFAGGILALGNTPGVCLFAPGARWGEPPPPPTQDAGHLAMFEESLIR